MSNIAINSQPQPPYEEAKILKIHSSGNRHLTKESTGLPFSKIGPTTTEPINPSERIDKL